jgi:hypothetical protein
MIILPSLKRGDTCQLFLELYNDMDMPLSGEVSKLKAQIRDINGAYISEFVITETETPGRYLLDCEDSSVFPFGYIYSDIMYHDGDFTSHTETIRILVEEGVTE